MEKVRKGFTLIELLIVITIIGALSAMMAMSSAGAIDASEANAILSNLQSLKVASYQMYMDEPKIASLAAIALDGSTQVGTGDTRTIKQVLGSYLGKSDKGIVDKGYGLIGSSTSWYVVYKLDANNSAGVREKLKAKADDAGLYCLYGENSEPNTTEANCRFSSYYNFMEGAGKDAYIALKVR